MEEAQLNHRSIHHRTGYSFYYQIYNNSTCKDMKFYLPDSPIWALGSLCRSFIEADICLPFCFLGSIINPYTPTQRAQI
ncbi:hypothetical protein C1H46_033111 [Malus baccata]|uniref:Uncharacterized protein n=1 Tax=Malus baccata TaxID=106549 RepID=A0A540L4C8_MALBA|nr:hypothetical protein C1H46_033111 [Malus baccata]